MEMLLLVVNVVGFLSLAVLCIVIRQSLTSYASEKGRNVATKEDIAEITRLIETTKLSLQHQDRFEAKKYELKYNACLGLLRIVDAQLSHLVQQDNDGKPVKVDKQFASADEIRACHSEIILALDDPAIVQVFLAILTGTTHNAITELDRLRGLIRAELGFAGVAHTDANRTWIGKSVISRGQ